MSRGQPDGRYFGPEANHSHLLVECLSCGKKTLEVPFMQHCKRCRKKPEVQRLYKAKSHTMSWHSKNESKGAQ